jgi:serine/threonine protein kinase
MVEAVGPGATLRPPARRGASDWRTRHDFSPPEVATINLIGQNLGPYRVVEQLGAGGMATVYKAYHPAMDRYVALKVPSTQLLEDVEFRDRFQREARIIAQLEHPHILPVHDFGEDHGVPYLVMRYVDGGTLRDLATPRVVASDQTAVAVVAPGGVLPFDLTARLIAEVAEALAYAHRRGVIHRDVKPANVLLDRDRAALLTDFGIARLVEQTMQLTRGILGTPYYMAPEQVAGNQPVDARADIYSLGVVLYELLTGRRPYEGETPMAVAFKHLTDPLSPPRQVNPGLPEIAERIILTAMAKDPADRYPQAGDLARDLRRWLLALDEASDAGTVRQPASKLTEAAESKLAAEITGPGLASPVDRKTNGKSQPEAAAEVAGPGAPVPIQKSPGGPSVQGGRDGRRSPAADGAAPPVRRRSPFLVAGGAVLAVLVGLFILGELAGPPPDPTPIPTATLTTPVAMETSSTMPAAAPGRAATAQAVATLSADQTTTTVARSPSSSPLVGSVGTIAAVWTATAAAAAPPSATISPNRAAAILETAVAGLTPTPVGAAQAQPATLAALPTATPATAAPSSASAAPAGLVGPWQIMSARIFYDVGGGGNWSPTGAGEGLTLAADGTWVFGSSSGRWQVQPITAKDWQVWGVQPYGPTQALVLHGWNGEDATGPIEEKGQQAVFVWVIYRVAPPTVAAPGKVDIKFGHG